VDADDLDRPLRCTFVAEGETPQIWTAVRTRPPAIGETLEHDDHIYRVVRSMLYSLLSRTATFEVRKVS
jgi:hypothetical protein